jgi:hypothetical protein
MTNDLCFAASSAGAAQRRKLHEPHEQDETARAA